MPDMELKAAMAMNGQLHGGLPMDTFDHDLGFDDPLLFVFPIQVIQGITRLT